MCDRFPETKSCPSSVAKFSPPLIGINGLNAFGKKSRTLQVYGGLCGIAVGLIILTTLSHVWSTILGNLIIGFSVAGISSGWNRGPPKSPSEPKRALSGMMVPLH